MKASLAGHAMSTEKQGTGRIRLCEIRGDTSIFIDAEITAEGNLLVSGQDVGEAPQQWWGDTDYEYWLQVPAAEKDRVLLALLQACYAGDAQVVSKLRDVFETAGIPHTFDSWI